MVRASVVVLLSLTAVFAGCISGDDDPFVNPTVDTPDPRLVPTFVNTQPSSVTKLDAFAQLMDGDSAYPSGGGNWVQGNYVYGSSLGNGFFIADISDPAHPVLVFDEPNENATTPFARKAEVVTHPDGRLTLVLATQSDGMAIWDVTDPTAPVFASILEELNPNHNIAMVPGTELVFNNPSGGQGRTNELIDVSDPYNPKKVGNFGAFGCHGTTWHGRFGDPDFRAYCAAIQRTEIWDMTGLDVTATDLGIKLLGVVETLSGNSPVTGNPAFASSPVRTLHHLAMGNAAGDVLIIGDEHNGGGSPGVCIHNDGTRSTPFGALWFYDISDESNPVMLSWISPPLVSPRAPNVPADPTSIGTGTVYGSVPNCTAHFGTLVPGEEKLVMAWYSAGVLLIDFTDPEAPAILDQFQPENVNAWNARVHNGYVFTGDIRRGMDVLKLA